MKLATSLALVLLLAVSGAALAIDPTMDNSIDRDAVAAEKDAHVVGLPNPVPQVGGDTIANAANIPVLPYSDSGNTCSFANDYDEVCPYTGSTAPDVVYKYSPAADVYVNISLCNTLDYDTKLYVYQNAAGNLVACNDDAGCGYFGSWSSEVTGVFMQAGNTYYIVVDGYSSGCGPYIFDMWEDVPCVVDCPAGAYAEGEPSGGCAQDYQDNYNGGCNSNPNVFQSVPCSVDGSPVTICGGMGGFSYFGSSYRDTDWYLLEAAYNLSGVTACLNAELDGVLGYITPAPCDQISTFDDYVLADPCIDACINIPAGDFWVFVGANGFGPGFGCGDYTLTLSGYDCGAVSVEPATWGEIKGQYK